MALAPARKLAPIVTAPTTNEDRTIATLAMAFTTDPVARWTWPDPLTYLANFAAFARAFGGAAFTYRTALVAGDYAGAALWLPPGVEPDSDAMAALLEATVPEARLGEMYAFLEQMGQFHPTEPHWYLPMLGVDPCLQGKGYGSALLRHALEHCDRDGLPAYLESSNPRNVPLYERHGFEVIGVIQTGASPTMHAMLRTARFR
jgi:ribosomal protein S18 acetylase RimI-like enzyme